MDKSGNVYNKIFACRKISVQFRVSSHVTHLLDLRGVVFKEVFKKTTGTSEQWRGEVFEFMQASYTGAFSEAVPGPQQAAGHKRVPGMSQPLGGLW